MKQNPIKLKREIDKSRIIVANVTAHTSIIDRRERHKIGRHRKL